MSMFPNITRHDGGSKDKSKRASSFLDKFSTFRNKDKKERPRVDRSSFQAPDGDSFGESEYQSLIDKMADSDIEAKFEQMLDDMNLTEEKKTPLRKLPVARKRIMLAMQYKGSMVPKGKLDAPEEFIQELNSPYLKGDKRYDVLASLRIALTNNPVSWVHKFGVNGLNALLKNLTYCYQEMKRLYGYTNNREDERKLKSERKNTLECVRCLKAYMNSTAGLMQIIQHEEALIILARSVDPRDPAAMLEAVRLLAAVCLVPPEGHEKALEGITVDGEIRNQDRFTSIIQGLSMDDPQMKMACMQLINALISTPDDIDFRLHLRNEFMRTGLTDALETLELETNEDVKRQVNVFHEHKEEDFDEVQHRYDNVRFEWDESQDIFKLLYQTTLNTPAEPFFVSILQHLLCIRDDSIARPQYYKLIEECVSQIVLHKNGVDPDFRYTKRFEIDVEPLIGKLSEDSDENSLTSGVAPRDFKSKLEEALTAKQEFEARVATLDNKVKAYETENADLKERLSASIGAAVSGVLTGGGGGPPPPPPPPIPGGGGPPPPPPPPLPGGPPPPPPPPLPGGGGPPPPPPPPPPGGGPPPPPPPPGCGPPPPPGLMGMMRGGPGGVPTPPPQNPFPHGMKAKKKYKPEQQMKRANWNKIKPNQVDPDAFWVKTHEDELEDEELFKELMNNFATKAPAKKITTDEGGETKSSYTKKKGKEFKVLDAKAGQNLSILLGSIKVPNAELKRRILEVDEGMLNAQVVEQLIKFMPAPEQMQEITKFKSQYDELAEPEQFALEMSSIKRIVPRLKSIFFKMRFSEYISEVKPDIVAATAALEEIKHSKKFAKILELILLMGNYMNSGSRNEQSIGFELSYLTKLTNTKAHDNRTTLLHFMVSMIEKKHPDLLTFDEEMIHVAPAARVSGDNLTKSLAQMNKSLNQLGIDLKNAQNEKNPVPNDKFVDVMAGFVNSAKEQVEVLDSMFQKMQSLFKNASRYYAFDSRKYTLEEFFTDLKTFTDNFKQALKDNQKLRETEEKIKRAKEAKEKAERERREKMARKRALLDITADNDQEGVMDNLIQALNTGTAFNVRERKEGRRRTPRAAGAERRAQLARSRSRTNILSPEQARTTEVAREINFSDEATDSPKSDAEELLRRLKAM